MNKLRNFLSQHRLFSYIFSALLVVIAVVVLIFAWKPTPPDIQVNTYAIMNTTFVNLTKTEDTLLSSKDDFGMTEDDVHKLFENKNSWTLYSLVLDVKNNHRKDIVFDGFNYENKSGRGYFVKTASGGETGIGANSSGTIEVYVLIDCNELDDNEIDELLNHLDVGIKYYYVDSILEDYPEKPNYKEVKFSDV